MNVIQTSLEDDKAEDIVTVELSGKTSIADYMVIASGQSTRQVGAMADHIFRKLKATGLTGIVAEGQSNSDWVLIDAGDVIVHLFRPEVRSFYNLEKLWSHAELDAELDGEPDMTVRVA
ncbi:MAG: ribosome silencing factor [Alphaproteobacteria bacterium]|nr:ribosome silencing factor [Alphaproteobacteria bacterium]